MVTRYCKMCNDYHEVFKQIFKDRSQHLIVFCDKGTHYIPYEDIDVPIIKTGRERKMDRMSQLQLGLSLDR